MIKGVIKVSCSWAGSLRLRSGGPVFDQGVLFVIRESVFVVRGACLIKGFVCGRGVIFATREPVCDQQAGGLMTDSRGLIANRRADDRQRG